MLKSFDRITLNDVGDMSELLSVISMDFRVVFCHRRFPCQRGNTPPSRVCCPLPPSLSVTGGSRPGVSSPAQHIVLATCHHSRAIPGTTRTGYTMASPAPIGQSIACAITEKYHRLWLAAGRDETRYSGLGSRITAR
jgi:hypothetical protein